MKICAMFCCHPENDNVFHKVCLWLSFSFTFKTTDVNSFVILTPLSDLWLILKFTLKIVIFHYL